MLHPVLFLDALEILLSSRREDMVLAGYTASKTRGDCTFDGYPLQFYLRGKPVLPYSCVESKQVKELPAEIEYYKGWKVLNREATIYSMFEFENDDWSIMEMISYYCDNLKESNLTNYFKHRDNGKHFAEYLSLLEDSRTMYNY